MRKYLIILSIFPVLILVGCAATLEDFQGMSKYERTQYVCENHREVRRLDSDLDSLEIDIKDTQKALRQGYRVHQSCKTVLVPDTQECTTTQSASPGTAGTVSITTSITASVTTTGTIKCKNKTKEKRICDDIPVAIDGNLEKEKLAGYQDSYDYYRDELSYIYEECEADVQNLSAEGAFRYYERVQ